MTFKQLLSLPSQKIAAALPLVKKGRVLTVSILRYKA